MNLVKVVKSGVSPPAIHQAPTSRLANASSCRNEDCLSIIPYMMRPTTIFGCSGGLPPGLYEASNALQSTSSINDANRSTHFRPSASRYFSSGTAPTKRRARSPMSKRTRSMTGCGLDDCPTSSKDACLTSGTLCVLLERFPMTHGDQTPRVRSIIEGLLQRSPWGRGRQIFSCSGDQRGEDRHGHAGEHGDEGPAHPVRERSSVRTLVLDCSWK